MITLLNKPFGKSLEGKPLKRKALTEKTFLQAKSLTKRLREKRLMYIIPYMFLLSLYSVSAIQTARPDQDVNVNSWTVTPLWSKIDETVAVDTTGDRINSTLFADNGATNISLSSVTDPLSSPGHVMRVRYRRAGLAGGGGGCGGAGLLLGIRLFQGTTKIVNATYPNVPCTFAYANYTLTAAEADSITDYSNLTVMFYGKIMNSTLPRRKLQVSWAEMEVPAPLPSRISLFSITKNSLFAIRKNSILRIFFS